MDHRIVWVHGIGDHKPGYSSEWQRNFNPYLNLQPESYVEVVWESVFDAARQRARGRRADAAALLTAQEELAAADVRRELQTILLARASTAMEAQPPAVGRGRRAAVGGVVEWSALQRRRTQRGLFDWLRKPDEYLGDFAKYLVSRRLRTAVKERAKEHLRPLSGDGYRVSVVSHSWGTVVAYDALLDLEVELPALRDVTLVTLGSPLWLVRRLLEDSSGRKPGGAATWLNITARGDLVGSWLSPAFAVDKDFQVPHVGEGDPHGSYFVAGNEAVQRDLVAQTILG
jgi:hypothetical protein